MRDGWKAYGPYEGNQGRRIVVLTRGHKPNRESTSIAYAKWVLEQKLGRILSREEEADHIDEDPRNDHPDNLQVLTQLENIQKSNRGRELFYFDCPACGNPAVKEAAQVRHNRNLGKAGPFCGKSCAAKHGWTIQRSRLSPTTVEARS